MGQVSLLRRAAVCATIFGASAIGWAQGQLDYLAGGARVGNDNQNVLRPLDRGRKFAALGPNNGIAVWDGARLAATATFSDPDGYIEKFSASRDASIIAYKKPVVGITGESIVRIDANTLERSTIFSAPLNRVINAIAVSPNGASIGVLLDYDFYWIRSDTGFILSHHLLNLYSVRLFCNDDASVVVVAGGTTRCIEAISGQTRWQITLPGANSSRIARRSESPDLYVLNGSVTPYYVARINGNTGAQSGYAETANSLDGPIDYDPASQQLFAWSSGSLYRFDGQSLALRGSTTGAGAGTSYGVAAVPNQRVVAYSNPGILTFVSTTGAYERRLSAHNAYPTGLSWALGAQSLMSSMLAPARSCIESLGSQYQAEAPIVASMGVMHPNAGTYYVGGALGLEAHSTSDHSLLWSRSVGGAVGLQALSTDGNMLAVAAGDLVVVQTSGGGNVCSTTIPTMFGTPRSISWNPTGTRVLVGNTIVSVPDGAILRELPAGNALSASTFSKTGSQAIVANGPALNVYDSDTGALVRTIQLNQEVQRMVGDPMQPVVAVGYGTSGAMQLVNYAQGLVEYTTTEFTGGGIQSLKYSFDGHKIAMGCFDGSISVIENPIAFRQFDIRSSRPVRSARVPSLALEVSGDGCEQCTRITLESGGVTVAEATNLRPGFFKIYCTLDVSALAFGFYDVVGYASDGTVDKLPAALEINSTGLSGNIGVVINMPEVIRPDREYTAEVVLTNLGSDSTPAPLYRISGDSNVMLRMSWADHWTQEGVMFLATGGGPNHRVIYPGESVSIPIRFKVPADAVLHSTLNLNLNEVTYIPDMAFLNNWTAIVSAIGVPSAVEPTAWARIWEQFVAQIGSSFNEYVNAMRDQAHYLAENGATVYNADKLFTLAMARASNELAPIADLSSNTDAQEPSRLISLELERFAPVGIDRRYRLGPLGRGWFHSYEYTLREESPSQVDVTVPGDGRREFLNIDGRGFKGEAGDIGKLVRLETGGFTLTESDGKCLQFGPAGNIVEIREPNGNKLTFAYAAGRLSSVQHPGGGQLTFGYNGDGRIANVTDSAGRVTTYTYDGTGEFLSQVTLPGGRQLTYSYNAPGVLLVSFALRQAVAPGGEAQNFDYDSLGRLVTVSFTGGLNPVTFEYPGLGQVNVVDADGKRTSIFKGEEGQQLREVSPLGAARKTAYDEAMNPVQEVGPLGETTARGFDRKGNALFTTDAEGRAVNAGYTLDFNGLDWLRDARGNLLDLEYDEYGNTTRVNHPLGSYQRFDYDANGNISAYTNRRGQLCTYTYNSRGQLTAISWPTGRSFAYAYDTRGNLISASDSETGNITMLYDTRDFMTRINYPGGKWFEYDYDGSGKRTQRRSNDGFTLNYGYDALGRLTSVSDGSFTPIVAYGYNAVSRLALETKANGTTTSYAYDFDSRLTTIQHNTGSGTATYSYGYDLSGRPTSLTTPAGTYTYGYDRTGQLVSVQYPGGSSATVSYDPAGNRLNVNEGGITAYTANELNEYTGVGASTYAYDLDGNMVGRAEPSGATTYGYDIAGRLISVTRSGLTESYEYDALGNRIRVTTNGSVSNYLFDGTGIATELDGGGALAARYVHGLGLAARLDGTGSYFYNFDLTGNTRQLTGPAGSVVNSYEYQPFGNLISSTEGVTNPFRYVGRYGVMGDASGLYWMRARHYDAGLGRFIQPDPIGLVGEDTNLYGYTVNSPVGYIDPSGTCPNEREKKEKEKDKSTRGTTPAPPGPQYGPLTESQEKFRRYRATHPRGFSIRTKQAVMGVRGEAPKEDDALVAMVVTPLEEAPFVEPTSVHNCRLPVRVAWPFGMLFTILTPDPQGCSPCQEAAKDIPRETPKDEQSRGNGASSIRTSEDPNEKRGPVGVLVDNVGWLTSYDAIEYQVLFENYGQAHAQEVIITDFLDPDLDWSSMALGGITFGSQSVTDFMGRQSGTFYVPLEPPLSPGPTNPDNSDLVAKITVTFDRLTGKIAWRLETIDPLTMEPPNGVYQGILAPNRDAQGQSYGDGRGEGKVVFSIMPRTRPDGTFLTNKANIIFDTNAPILTNIWTNAIDVGAPVSAVNPLPATSTPWFNVSWGGYDSGSGIASYDVYVSVNGGAYSPWKQNTTATSAQYRAPLRVASYRFYSVAKDKLGHTEIAPGLPDATTTVSPIPRFPAIPFGG